MASTGLRGDDLIDLQIHTIYSDGQWRPQELFEHLAEAGFRAVAITDHDRIDRAGELRALGEARGIAVIPGVELTTSWRGLSAHLLCYAPTFAGDALAALGDATVRQQLENTRAVSAELLRRGYVFPRQAEILGTGGVVRPNDNARLLQAHGYAQTPGAALELIRAAGYHSVAAPLEEAVAAAHADGGVAVLAHPGRGGGEIQRYDPPLLAELLAAVPLDGIEVRYPLHTPEQVAAYTAFATARGLLMGAGSDSHGPRQRLPIPYPARGCAALLARCGLEVR